MGREIRELLGDGMRRLAVEKLQQGKQMTDANIGGFFSERGRDLLLFAQNWNNILPPWITPEKIKHWLLVGLVALAAVAAILIGIPLLVCVLKFCCLCLINSFSGLMASLSSCFAFLFHLIVAVLRGLLLIIAYFFTFLFRCLVALFQGLKIATVSLASFVRSCFPCFAAAGVKMMKAPGQAGVMIVRATFESNPAAYFSALRLGL